jgi:hypothetical protein
MFKAVSVARLKPNPFRRRNSEELRNEVDLERLLSRKDP